MGLVNELHSEIKRNHERPRPWERLTDDHWSRAKLRLNAQFADFMNEYNRKFGLVPQIRVRVLELTWG